MEQRFLHCLISSGEQDINMRVLQMIRKEHIKVIKVVVDLEEHPVNTTHDVCFCSTASW